MLGLKRGVVRLEKYNPKWKVFFDEEKARLKELLGSKLFGVEHVGSTSIPGIKAKPILDLMIAIKDLNDWTWLKEPLAKLGYEFRRDYRETQGHILFVKGSEENRTHYLKATELNSDFWIEHIIFRDYLINNPKYLKQYQELKEKLFKQYNGDREPYTKAKEKFIKMILRKAMKKEEMKKLVIEEFGGEYAQDFYVEKAEEGFWDSEEYFISKYFNKKGSILDVGCGTGRTTIPLVRRGYNVVGIDIVPEMIKNAKEIARKKNLSIDYRVGDATKLNFNDNSFDYLLFSNQGWSQIPAKEERLRALKEMRRVLKDGGICIFTVHPRVWFSKYIFFWLWQWIRLFVLKPFGFNIDEIDFGDRFFKRENSRKDGKTYKKKQYIHIASIKEVKKEIERAGFRIIEVNGKLQISEKDTRKHPAVFYVCEK